MVAKAAVSGRVDDSAMHVVALGRNLRMVRIKRRARQSDVAVKARISATVVGRHEAGECASISALDRHAAAIGLRLELRLIGRAGEVDRLSDVEHAAIVEGLAERLREEDWITEPEASFSEYGERGRVDLLAFHPETGTLLLIEVKTLLVELGELFGRVNVKERLVPAIAQARQWRVERVTTVLAVASTSANRAIVRSHATLFGAFTVAPFVPRDLVRGGRFLCWITPGAAGRVGGWTAGRQRVRRGRRLPSGFLLAYFPPAGPIAGDGRSEKRRVGEESGYSLWAVQVKKKKKQ